jgi:ribonuclease J
MNKIDFVALGGLDERGKNCYALTINDNIFVFNVGIYFPSKEVLGLESAIPDVSYLVENSDKIKGIFIGSAFEKNFGGLAFLPEELKKIPFYTSNLNAFIINKYFNADINFKIVDRMKSFEINGIKITPFKIPNSLPNSLGFILNIDNDNVVYMDDCIINTSKSSILDNDILKIIPLVNEKNNLLLTSVGLVSTNNGFTTPGFQVQNYLNDLINENEGRIIIGLYSYDIYKIVSILNAANLTNRKISFINQSTYEIIKKMGSLEFINLAKFNIIDFKNLTNVDDDVIVIADEYPHELFDMLFKMCDGEYTNLLLNEKDTFLLAASTINGLEKQEADLFDKVNENDVKDAIKLDKKYLDLSASAEDSKFLVSLIKPKYIIPINSLYMDFVNYQNIIGKTGFNKKNIIILRNGQRLKLNNMIAEEKTEFIPLTAKLVNIQGQIDDNNNAIIERKQMQENGVVVVAYIIDTKQKKIIKDKYDIVGVISLTKDNGNIITNINAEIKNEINKILEEMLMNKDKIDVKEFKIISRKIITKQYEKKFSKKPLIMMTLLFN